MKTNPLIVLTLTGLLLAVGGLGVVTVHQHRTIAHTQEKLEKAEADARTAWGKVFDIQEVRDKRLDDANSAHSIDLWNLQAKLNACEAAKDGKK